MTQKLSNQVNNFRTGAIRETLEQGLPIAVGGSEYPGLALFLGAAISFVGLALTLAVRSEQAAAVGRAQVVENFGTTPIRGLVFISRLWVRTKCVCACRMAVIAG